MRMKGPILQLVLLLAPLRTRLGVAVAAYSLNEIDWDAYERGELGVYPQTRYRSNTAVSVPLIHVTESSAECDHLSYTLLSPRGHGVPGNKALILDNQGELVWFQQELGAINGFQAQTYKGHDYLTYWVGDDDYAGHGRGYYKMLDQTYNLAYTISGLNDIDGDFHEFSITADDTALLTAYVKLPWDLSVIGKENGFIWDSVFQEIDIETNSILFEWRASQHFTFNDMAVNNWEQWVGTDEVPWDWFHINSVEKDPWGNYLVSARNTNAITYIDGRNGNPLWHLGGDASTFVSLSEPSAVQFTNPQMARWTDNYTAITLFDNAGSVLEDQVQMKSRGLKIKLDGAEALATVVSELKHPNHVFAVSGGSLQVLKNGNYFLSYGSASVYSEFASNGTMLCNTHYSPIHTGKRAEFKPGFVKSYRVYKQTWIGYPTGLPNVKISGTTIYVSWNGATEVRAWKLEGRELFAARAHSWNNIGTFKKKGFETSIPINGAYYASYKLTALDSNEYLIRAWDFHPDGDIREVIYDYFPRNLGTSSSRNGGIFTIILCFGLLIAINRRYISEVQVGRGISWARLFSRRYSNPGGKYRTKETNRGYLSGWDHEFVDP